MTLMILKRGYKFCVKISLSFVLLVGIRMEKISLAPLYKICMFAHMGNIKSLNSFY